MNQESCFTFQAFEDNSSIISSVSSNLSSQDDNEFECFSENLYQSVEDFLDREGLHVSDTSSPSMKCTTLKPLLDMKRSLSLGLNSPAGLENFRRMSGSAGSAVPKFLAKRMSAI